MKIRIMLPGLAKPRCPRCGSPVVLRDGGWECGWCMDSGDLGALSGGTAGAEFPVRAVCRVELPRAWDTLREALDGLVPRQAAALTPALERAAIHQLSLSAPPEDGREEPRRVRELEAFLASAQTPDGAALAARIENGETLFAEEAALSAEDFGGFWRALLDALAEEGAAPGETDTDGFFRALALFRSWRRGGPGSDKDYLDDFHALQDAFHERWERAAK